MTPNAPLGLKLEASFCRVWPRPCSGVMISPPMTAMSKDKSKPQPVEDDVDRGGRNELGGKSDAHWRAAFAQHDAIGIDAASAGHRVREHGEEGQAEPDRNLGADVKANQIRKRDAKRDSRHGIERLSSVPFRRSSTADRECGLPRCCRLFQRSAVVVRTTRASNRGNLSLGPAAQGLLIVAR